MPNNENRTMKNKPQHPKQYFEVLIFSRGPQKIIFSPPSAFFFFKMNMFTSQAARTFYMIMYVRYSYIQVLLQAFLRPLQTIFIT